MSNEVWRGDEHAHGGMLYLVFTHKWARHVGSKVDMSFRPVCKAIRMRGAGEVGEGREGEGEGVHGVHVKQTVSACCDAINYILTWYVRVVGKHG